MGRTLDNALLNLGLKDEYKDGIKKLGFNMEDILEQERDAALGNGGLGRLAACYLDSGASQVNSSFRFLQCFIASRNSHSGDTD